MLEEESAPFLFYSCVLVHGSLVRKRKLGQAKFFDNLMMINAKRGTVGRENKGKGGRGGCPNKTNGRSDGTKREEENDEVVGS